MKREFLSGPFIHGSRSMVDFPGSELVAQDEKIRIANWGKYIMPSFLGRRLISYSDSYFDDIYDVFDESF